MSATGSLTVREYALGRWLPLLPREYALRTAREYEKRWRTHLDKAFGHHALGGLTRGDVRTWLRSLVAQGYALETIKAQLHALQSLYKRALKDELVEVSPLQLAGSGILERGRRHRPKPARLLPAQVNAILAAADAWDSVLFGVAFRTGLRRAELAGLQVDDIRDRRLHVQRQYFGKGIVIPETKHGGSRWVDLSTQAAVLLQNRVAVSTTWLFCRPGKTWPMHPNSLYRRYQDLTRRVGLPPSRLHGSRHTYATRLLEVTGDLAYVQAQMGHRDAQTTMIYTRDAEPMARLDLADRLDDGLVDVPVRRPPRRMHTPRLQLVTRRVAGG